MAAAPRPYDWSIVDKARDTPQQPSPPPFPGRRYSARYGHLSVAQLHERLRPCTTVDELSAAATPYLGHDPFIGLTPQLVLAEQGNKSSVVVWSGQCDTKPNPRHAGPSATVLNTFKRHLSEEMGSISINSLAHLDDEDECDDVSDEDAPMVRYLLAIKIMLIMSKFSIYQLVIFGSSGPRMYSMPRLTHRSAHDGGWLPQGLKTTTVTHFATLHYAPRQRKGALLLGYVAVLGALLGLADQERIKGFTLDLDTALQENTASWTKLDLVSALADLELASAEDLILPLPQALELLAKRSPDDLPEVIPVVFRYSSCPVRLTPDQVSELATLLRREGAEILKAQYGVDVDLDRFRPIMCTGHGGTTAMEFLRNEKWSPPEASFLRWLREVDAGQHKYAVVIGASTVATPSTLLLIARGLGPHGIVTFADSEKAPVTLRAVELASSLTQAVEEIGKLPKPQPGTYADIGRFALAVGEVIDALEDSSATSAVAARTRVALTCFVSRFLGSAYAASHAIDNTAHRWIANAGKKKDLGTLIEEDDDELDDDVEALADDEAAPSKDASTRDGVRSLERADLAELQDKYLEFGGVFAATKGPCENEACGETSPFTQYSHSSTARRRLCSACSAYANRYDGQLRSSNMCAMECIACGRACASAGMVGRGEGTPVKVYSFEWDDYVRCQSCKTWRQKTGAEFKQGVDRTCRDCDALRWGSDGKRRCNGCHQRFGAGIGAGSNTPCSIMDCPSVVDSNAPDPQGRCRRCSKQFDLTPGVALYGCKLDCPYCDGTVEGRGPRDTLKVLPMVIADDVPRHACDSRTQFFKKSYADSLTHSYFSLRFAVSYAERTEDCVAAAQSPPLHLLAELDSLMLQAAAHANVSPQYVLQGGASASTLPARLELSDAEVQRGVTFETIRCLKRKPKDKLSDLGWTEPREAKRVGRRSSRVEAAGLEAQDGETLVESEEDDGEEEEEQPRRKRGRGHGQEEGGESVKKRKTRASAKASTSSSSSSSTPQRSSTARPSPSKPPRPSPARAKSKRLAPISESAEEVEAPTRRDTATGRLSPAAQPSLKRGSGASSSRLEEKRQSKRTAGQGSRRSDSEGGEGESGDESAGDDEDEGQTLAEQTKTVDARNATLASTAVDEEAAVPPSRRRRRSDKSA